MFIILFKNFKIRRTINVGTRKSFLDLKWVGGVRNNKTLEQK